MKRLHTVHITHNQVVIDGVERRVKSCGKALLTELYNDEAGDYPRFFKMDMLCRLGFVATELLLKAEGKPRFEEGDDRAVVLFSCSGSCLSDMLFEETIRHREACFPSPAAFVYTLPNIVTGEIAMRNRYHGETNLMLLTRRNDELMERQIEGVLADGACRSVITGWIDAEGEDRFEAEVWIGEPPPTPPKEGRANARK